MPRDISCIYQPLASVSSGWPHLESESASRSLTLRPALRCSSGGRRTARPRSRSDPSKSTRWAASSSAATARAFASASAGPHRRSEPRQAPRAPLHRTIAPCHPSWSAAPRRVLTAPSPGSVQVRAATSRCVCSAQSQRSLRPWDPPPRHVCSCARVVTALTAADVGEG